MPKIRIQTPWEEKGIWFFLEFFGIVFPPCSCSATAINKCKKELVNFINNGIIYLNV